MTTQAQLEALMQEARTDPFAEPRFFAALLDATLYAHVPLEQVPGRIRFCQFVHSSDGKTLLPVFTDESRAAQASQGVVGVLAMRGRRLLELTQGAIVAINPNEDHCVLYPEEIAALLQRGTLPAFTKEVLTESERVAVCPPTVSTVKLTDVLVTLYKGMPSVTAAYLIEVGRGEDYTDRSLLLGVLVTDGQEERVKRASAAAMQSVLRSTALPVVLLAFSPLEPMPSLYREVMPFYNSDGPRPHRGRTYGQPRTH